MTETMTRDTPERACLRRSASMAAVISAVILSCWGAGQPARAQTFTVIHNFNLDGTDGIGPLGAVVADASGNLYGTTQGGGSSNGVYGCGTVFKIDAAGNESILHSFNCNGIDGYMPHAGLILDALGNHYGTTETGGSGGCGTVFKVEPSGNESVLHSFTGWPDGCSPIGGLVRDVSGNLFGTTEYGGSGSDGTVFKIDVAGNETILHNFSGTDGADPWASLALDSSGNLYGTTLGGGTSDHGTVFKVDAAGNETVLHNFIGTDGATLKAGLILDASGNLYGTASEGGAAGFGTVFKIDSSGNATVIHAFNGTDGAYPKAGLTLDASGNLYGTTSEGGASDQGTVFKVDAAGNETVLHNFTGSDGGRPYAGVIWDASGNLYGTTYGGGAGGYGTVFKISFSVPFSSFSAKLSTTAGAAPRFQLQAFFTPGAGAQVFLPQSTGAGLIDPVAQGMTLSVGTYTVAIPPGSFHQTKKGWWVYEGTVAGAVLDIRISLTGANPYELQFEASDVDLTSLANPLTVTLAFGNNNGTTQVNQ